MGPIKLSRNAVLALTLASALFALPTLAQAGDDDDVPFDTRIVRGILEDLGLRSDRDNDINYQERAPLVIPPSRDLPPPQQPGAAIAQNPAWPKDPDITRARLAEQQEKNRNIQAEIEREENPLPPDQLGPNTKRKVVRTTKQPDDPSSGTNGDEHYRMTPSQLGYQGNMFGNIFGGSSIFGGNDDSSAKFTGEPARASLTDPPVGYQTPSPDQPYGVVKDKSLPKATQSYSTHGEVTSGNTQ